VRLEEEEDTFIPRLSGLDPYPYVGTEEGHFSDG
jgi:hypothetical protein